MFLQSPPPTTLNCQAQPLRSPLLELRACELRRRPLIRMSMNRGVSISIPRRSSRMSRPVGGARPPEAQKEPSRKPGSHSHVLYLLKLTRRLSFVTPFSHFLMDELARACVCRALLGNIFLRFVPRRR